MLVTGASSGIGARTASELADRGFTVFGSVHRREDWSRVAGLRATPVMLEVTDGASIAAARATVEGALAGRPFVGLVNNAGIPAAGPLELIPVDELRRILEVNVVGVVAVTQAFLPLLTAAHGRIVNISSVSGYAALPFMGPYAASKFALEALSDSLRRELLPFGVDVIVIQPGSFRTRIWEKVEAMDMSPYRGTAYGAALERFRDQAIRGGRRAPPPDRVARAVGQALTARRPPARMLVTDHALLTRLVFGLPDRWLDWLIGRAVWRGV